MKAGTGSVERGRGRREGEGLVETLGEGFRLLSSNRRVNPRSPKMKVDTMLPLVKCSVWIVATFL